MQALYLLALLPVAETTADPNSYGFRPERSTADAIEQCFRALSQKNSARWVLEGDTYGRRGRLNCCSTLFTVLRRGRDPMAVRTSPSNFSARVAE